MDLEPRSAGNSETPGLALAGAKCQVNWAVRGSFPQRKISGNYTRVLNKVFAVVYSFRWTSLITQLVKNPPAMRETRVQFLGWEDRLEKGRTTHSSILAWRIPWTV